jgi:hypothetical protein
MSQENVDFILEGFERFEADEPDVEARWHENSVLTGPEGWPEQGPFEGPEAIRRQFDRLGDNYAEARFTDIEVLADQGE